MVRAKAHQKISTREKKDTIFIIKIHVHIKIGLFILLK